MESMGKKATMSFLVYVCKPTAFAVILRWGGVKTSNRNLVMHLDSKRTHPRMITKHVIR